MAFVVLFNAGGERASKQGEDEKEKKTMRNKQTERGKRRTEEASVNRAERL